MTSKERFEKICQYVKDNNLETVVTAWIGCEVAREYSDLYATGFAKHEWGSQFIQFYHFLNSLNEEAA